MKTLLWVKQFYDAWGFYPMAGGTLGDGSAWDETNPVDGTLVSQIDDYDRDLRIGVRGRMALEHEWPSSQAATSQAGVHKFITLQVQAAKPTIAGTQLAAIYAKTVGAGLTEMFFENEAGTEVQVTNRTGLGSQLLLKVGRAIFNTAVATGASFPADGTIPQITEGGAAATYSYTPFSATSTSHVRAIIGLINNAVGGVVAAMFIGTTADAVAVGGQAYDAQSGRLYTVPLEAKIIFGTTAAVPVYIRMGTAGDSGTVTFCPTSLYGAVNMGSIVIEEYSA